MSCILNLLVSELRPKPWGRPCGSLQPLGAKTMPPRHRWETPVRSPDSSLGVVSLSLGLGSLRQACPRAAQGRLG